MSFNQGETVRPWDTETLCENGDLWEGLKRFHRVVLDTIAEALAVATAQADSRREGARRRDAAMVSKAMAELSRPDRIGRVSSTLPGAVDTATDGPLLAACRAVGAAQGIEIGSPRYQGADDPLRVLARASGFRTRRIKLTARWWSKEGGPMLGYRAEDGRPVALIPDPARGYVLVDAADKSRVTVTAAVAGTLRSNAVVFYRTLAAGKPTIGGLIGFTIPLIRGEIRTLLTIGLLAGLVGLVVPFAMVVAIDDVIPGADRGQLGLICALLVAMAFAIASFQAIQTLVLARLRGKLESGLLPAFWDRLLNLPARFFSRYEAGDLAVRRWARSA